MLEAKETMKLLLRRLLLSRKTVYVTALMAGICIVIGGSGLLVLEVPALVRWTFFVLGTVCLCCSWISFVIYDRVIGKQTQVAELRKIAKQLSAFERLAETRLDEHREQLLSEYKTHSFYNLLSLEDLKESVDEATGRTYEA